MTTLARGARWATRSWVHAPWPGAEEYASPRFRVRL